jgi:hypothetical protein
LFSKSVKLTNVAMLREIGLFRTALLSFDVFGVRTEHALPEDLDDP